MLNKESKNKLLKISSEQFIKNLEKRGNIYNQEIKKNMYTMENESKKNNLERSSLYDKYNIPKDISKLIEIFQILDDYNINYINYVLIFDNLNIQQLKNFYRYLMVKWNKVKNNLNDLHDNNNYMEKINNFEFKDIISIINNINNYEKVNEIIQNKIKDFIYIDNNKFPNIYIIFFINTLQEYLYPI